MLSSSTYPTSRASKPTPSRLRCGCESGSEPPPSRRAPSSMACAVAAMSRAASATPLRMSLEVFRHEQRVRVRPAEVRNVAAGLVARADLEGVRRAAEAGDQPVVVHREVLVGVRHALVRVHAVL